LRLHVFRIRTVMIAVALTAVILALSVVCLQGLHFQDFDFTFESGR